MTQTLASLKAAIQTHGATADQTNMLAHLAALNTVAVLDNKDDPRVVYMLMQAEAKGFISRGQAADIRRNW